MKHQMNLEDMLAHQSHSLDRSNSLFSLLRCWNFDPDPVIFNPQHSPFQDVYGGGGGWNPELGSGAETYNNCQDSKQGVPYDQACDGNQGYARNFTLGEKDATGYVMNSFNIEGTNIYERARYDGGDHINIDTIYRQIGERGTADTPSRGELDNLHLRPSDFGWEGKMRDIIKVLRDSNE